MLVERNGIETAVENKNDCAGGVCSYSDCGAAATTTYPVRLLHYGLTTPMGSATGGGLSRLSKCPVTRVRPRRSSLFPLRIAMSHTPLDRRRALVALYLNIAEI